MVLPADISGEEDAMTSNRRDSGSIVLGWLTKLMVIMLLVGVVLFDFVAVGVSRMSAADDANTAAEAASSEWQHSHDVQLAYNAAVQAITNPAEHVLVRVGDGLHGGVVRKLHVVRVQIGRAHV